jgi:hypothetical protein
MKILKGKSITLRLPNGEERKSAFAIVELDDITASHNERTFASSVGYPVSEDGHNINDRNYSGDKQAQAQVMEYARDLKPELLITTSRSIDGTPIINADGFVVSGNNRTMSLKLAKQDYPQNYIEYFEFLKEEYQAFGIDYENFKKEKFNYPVLVRIDYDIPALNTAELAKYNQSTQKGKRPVDKAIELSAVLRTNPGCRDGMAHTLTDYERMSSFYTNGSDQKTVIDLMVKCNLVTEQQKPEFWTPETGFTQVGKNFMETVLASVVLDKESLTVAETDGVKSVRQVIVTSLPVIMQNASLTEGSLVHDLNDAVLLQNEKVRSGLQFANFLSQSNIFATEQKIFSFKSLWLNLLLNRGQRAFKATMERYNNSVSSNTGESLFATELLSPTAVFENIILTESTKNSDSENQDKKAIELYANAHNLLPKTQPLEPKIETKMTSIRNLNKVEEELTVLRKRMARELKNGKTEKDINILRLKEKDLMREYATMKSIVDGTFKQPTPSVSDSKTDKIKKLKLIKIKTATLALKYKY